jgi:dCTP diphosphatase
VDIAELKATLRAFAAERDWEQFHSPKNLSMAASVEAAELLEHFQWLSEEQSYALPPDVRDLVAHEIADILIYLVRLADRLDIDVDRAVQEKIAINERKYPSDRVRGNAAKSTTYDDQEK